MQTDLTEVRTSVPAELQEKVLLGGDLARLTPAERLSYYNAVCTSVGLNPLTRPFEYLVLNGRMTLYARKDCTDQLRDKHEVSIQIVGRELVDGVYVVTAQAKNVMGRTDESIGAVPLPTGPADKANAMMKAETKAKRRVTLSICGLGILDESELDTVPQAKVVEGEASRPAVMDAKRTAQAKIQELREQPPAPAIETPTESPAAILEDYLAKIDLSQSVSEVSALLNAAVKDERLDVMQVTKVQDVAKVKIVALRKRPA